jgi:hypothetical protein
MTAGTTVIHLHMFIVLILILTLLKGINYTVIPCAMNLSDIISTFHTANFVIAECT